MALDIFTLELCPGYRDLMKKFNLCNKQWQLGKNKVFLRGVVHEPLEDARTQIVTKSAILIQKIWKGFAARNREFHIYATFMILKYTRTDLLLRF